MPCNRRLSVGVSLASTEIAVGLQLSLEGSKNIITLVVCVSEEEEEERNCQPCWVVRRSNESAHIFRVYKNRR